MVRTTNVKEKYMPVEQRDENIWVISWDYQPIMDRERIVNEETGKAECVGEEKETNLASWMMEVFHYKPSYEHIQNMILNWHNERIDREILEGFKWTNKEGVEMNVWLSSENQFNYKAAYDLAVQTQGMSLPVQFKFGSTKEPIYHNFKTLEDLTNFYVSAMTYINQTLAGGWKKKDEIDWSVYDELKRNFK